MKSFLSLLFLAATAAVSAKSAPDGDEAVFVYQPVVASAAAATFAPSCTTKYKSVVDICEAAMDDNNNDEEIADLFQFCRLLDFMNYLEDTGIQLDTVTTSNSNTVSSGNSFTIFAPTNDAISNLFDDILGTGQIGSTLIGELMESTIVQGKALKPRDLVCKSKLNVLSNAGPNPAIKCKGDIAGGPVSYIKGKGNSNAYTPRFQDPESFIATCNSNIYKIEDAILLKKYN